MGTGRRHPSCWDGTQTTVTWASWGSLVAQASAEGFLWKFREVALACTALPQGWVSEDSRSGALSAQGAVTLSVPFHFAWALLARTLQPQGQLPCPCWVLPST